MLMVCVRVLVDGWLVLFVDDVFVFVELIF